jgi:hypothetical protein
MKAGEKLQFIKDLIHERAQISPAGVLKLQLKDQPSLPVNEQILVLKKEALGILPAKKANNKDIIKNIKGVGYKLAP